MTNRFTIPEWIRKHNLSLRDLDTRDLDAINSRLRKLAPQRKRPEISIVIPAYNEEENLLNTLSSLSDLKTSRSVEILVVNNNSTDRTQQILDLCRVQSYFEPKQGISYARQHGLENASGKIILSADADTLYPPKWVDSMATPLEDPEIACVYGRYSFIPSGPGSSRLYLGLHETCAEWVFNLRKNEKESINVMGFNSGFRKADALKVGGYDHNLQREITGRSEDGWMAYLLIRMGKIQLVNAQDARVWTSNRRLVYDGGMGRAFYRRFKKEAGRIGMYLFPEKAQT